MTAKKLMKKAMQGVAGDQRAKDVKLTAFLGLPGDQYQRELMLVGRAVNGWTEWQTDQFGTESAMEAFIDNLDRRKQRCRLEWVCLPEPPDFYNANRSAFWRTARIMLEHLTGPEPSDICWASRLVWTNLYKVSLHEGNPPDWMCELQEAACIEMLRSELVGFKPKRVLISTGWDWAGPFLKAADVTKTSGKYVEASGLVSTGTESAHCVVAVHPRSKPEGQWVTEVCAAFEELAGR